RGETAGGLVRNQAVAVFVLADGDIRGGKIQDNRRARQRGIAGRWNRDPEILADFHEKRRFLPCLALEEKMLAKRNLPLVKEVYGSAARCRCGSELAILAELAIVR